jgi:adenosine deaminase/adenosine deaminase CECR1
VDIAHESDAVELMALMKQRPVAVEVNLTSNDFILGVKGDAHPVLLYARHGVPFVLSTDDAGVSRNNLSGEYMLYASRYKPDYAELKQIAYNSVRYSFLPPQLKQQEMTRLDKRFAEFEARIARLPRAALAR